MTTTINNKNKKANVPNLRFPEFQGEWEEHTLQDVVTFSNGKAHENSVNDDGDYILVNSKFVSTNGQVQKRVTSQLSPLHKSQFVMVMSDLPNGKALAKCFYVEEDNKYTLNQRVCSFTSNNGNVSRFLMYQINRNKYYLRFDDGINQTNLKKSEVLSCPVFIPIVREQEKIATLLCKIDERIATQNKIIEDLKKLKCAIIENHYRQAKLHKYKICDLGVPFSVGSLSKEDLSEEGHECILYGELFTTYDCVINEVKSHTNKIANTTLSQKGDLLFPSSTTVDAVSLISPSVIDIPNVILGGDMFGIHIDKKFNAYYLSYYINLIARKKLAIYAKGSTIIHLHYKDISKAQLLLPDLCEQDKITKCMIAEDAKIKVEEQLLTKLEKQKQYLLRQMFI